MADQDTREQMANRIAGQIQDKIERDLKSTIRLYDISRKYSLPGNVAHRDDVIGALLMARYTPTEIEAALDRLGQDGEIDYLANNRIKLADDEAPDTKEDQ